jgi:Tfp pilus assembly protein PilE
MKKQSQSGFAIVELAVIVVVIIALAGAGYYVWHSHHNKTKAPTTTSSLNYQSPPVTTASAPQISNASDLSKAIQTLDQTSVSSSNTDSSQLSTQTSGF